jgi:septum formation protein
MASDKFKLILGSQSPRRKELLSWLKIPFSIVTADLDEISHETDVYEIAMDLATQKAKAVQGKISQSEPFFIMASDTIVVLDGILYGKPKDRHHAQEILSKLSDRTHEVVTGVCFSFLDSEAKKIKTHRFFDKTEVTFNEITPELMNAYLDTGDSLDKAGAYGIQGPSLTFISKINGSYSNVVGFPLDKIVTELDIILGNDWRKSFI